LEKIIVGGGSVLSLEIFSNATDVVIARKKYIILAKD
jgi:hypothetical protein